MKAFQAYSNHGRATRNNARAAALAFFEAFPKARKCNVIEGESSNGFFTVTYNLRETGKRAQRWDDITKKQVQTLPSE